jgi:hypothetical protein
MKLLVIDFITKRVLYKWIKSEVLPKDGETFVLDDKSFIVIESVKYCGNSGAPTWVELFVTKA